MRPTRTVLAQSAAVLGLFAFLVGVFGDGKLDTADLKAIGLALGGASLMWFFGTRTSASHAAAYEAGRQDGYDTGYEDGRRVAKPVVVSLGSKAG
jgi:hypothetical protein